MATKREIEAFRKRLIKQVAQHVRQVASEASGNIETRLDLELDIALELVRGITVESRPLKVDAVSRKVMDRLEKRIQQRQK
jgi:hypothetical protein